jgi:hypothetical protein
MSTEIQSDRYEQFAAALNRGEFSKAIEISEAAASTKRQEAASQAYRALYANICDSIKKCAKNGGWQCALACTKRLSKYYTPVEMGKLGFGPIEQAISNMQNDFHDLFS